MVYWYTFACFFYCSKIIMDDVLVTAVAMRSAAGKIKKNINRIKYWVHQSHRLGADIACFPELSITGYSNSNAKFFAMSLNDDRIGSLFTISEKTNIIIVAGMVEKGISGKIYATHMIITPNKRMGIYRKIHIPHVEKKIFSGGNYLPVFKTRKIKIGLQLCYDAHFPELSTCMSQAGAELILIPHASPRGSTINKHCSWMRHLSARAFDNGVFVIACNQVGDNGEGLIFPGNALALSPSGRIIGKKISNSEGILSVSLKTEQMDHVRQHKMRYFLPNRRPKLYKEIPNTISLT